jgi:pantoate--beta-alanine ligase
MVEVIESTQKLVTIRSQISSEIGFVPTMGNLHAGHISLLEEALKVSETVFFSIFVNPKQFGSNEDFTRYPRTLQHDKDLIESCLKKFPGKRVFIYAPKDPLEVFPLGQAQTISVWDLSTELEGALRPGHFDGVATVVYRLFDLVKPKKAYFGLKDYQQYLVISKMVKDLKLPISIKGMPIVRDHDGLALSSRNQYLNSDQRLHALKLPKTLFKIKEMLGGKRSELARVQAFIDEEMKDPHWNYLEFRDALTFSPHINQCKKLTLLGVYQLGSTRLLDNLQMEIE